MLMIVLKLISCIERCLGRLKLLELVVVRRSFFRSKERQVWWWHIVAWLSTGRPYGPWAGRRWS